MIRRTFVLLFVLIFAFLLLHAPAFADSCDTVVHAFNLRLPNRIDEAELVDILRSLNRSNNRSLPDKFVTKREAKARGWKPGRDLRSVPALRGASIGGDRFGNHEHRVPKGNWREADLDYQGGHRGGKRIVFSTDGTRFVTVDHYRTFVEVPACR